MTDNELKKWNNEAEDRIIKALECCRMPVGSGACNNCPFDYQREKRLTGCDKSCTTLLFDCSLDLINRQKAEIGELTAFANQLEEQRDLWMEKAGEQKAEIKELDKLTIEQRREIDRLFNYVQYARAAANKEFAERLKEEITQAINSNAKARAERERKTKDFAEDALWHYCTGKIHCLQGLENFIDEFVAEKVGDAG
jgi:hypothetical protein